MISYLQIVSEIGTALATIFDVLPELTQLFAAMGSAGVVYEVIDQVGLLPKNDELLILSFLRNQKLIQILMLVSFLIHVKEAYSSLMLYSVIHLVLIHRYYMD